MLDGRLKFGGKVDIDGRNRRNKTGLIEQTLPSESGRLSLKKSSHNIQRRNSQNGLEIQILILRLLK